MEWLGNNIGLLKNQLIAIKNSVNNPNTDSEEIVVVHKKVETILNVSMECAVQC